jgi:hypothetical protein
MVDVGRQGQTTLNTVLGAIGTAGSLGIMSGLFGNGNGNNRNQSTSDGDRPVTRYEMSLMMENMKKDTEIAELKTRMAAMEEMNAMEKRQMEFNAQQMVYNATNNGFVAGLQEQTRQLQGMTKMVIPQANVVDVKTAAAATQTAQQGGGQ